MLHVPNIPGVVSNIGSFGGSFQAGFHRHDQHLRRCSGTDGVGTKLRWAFLTVNKHATIGARLRSDVRKPCYLLRCTAIILFGLSGSRKELS